MFAWINFSILLIASMLFLYYYVRSASPAGREKVIGARAYQLCFYNRLAAVALEFVITANYILYLLPHFYHYMLRRGTGSAAALRGCLCRVLQANRGVLA